MEAVQDAKTLADWNLTDWGFVFGATEEGFSWTFFDARRGKKSENVALEFKAIENG